MLRTAFREGVMGVCVSILLCFMLVVSGLSATAQSREPNDEVPEAFIVRYVASFTGPGDLHWTLPPKAETALRIIAGPPDTSPHDDTMKLPIAVVTDSHNRLLVADAGSMTVHVFDFTRRQYSDLDIAKIGMRSIAGIAVDDRNRIYLTDPRQGRVFILSPQGKFVGYLQEQRANEAYFVAPIGIAIDHARGYIYVCDRDRNMIIKLNRSGHVLRQFGVRGGGTGPGDFRLPIQIAISDGELFVQDDGNQRIQRLSPEGKFLGQFHIAEGVGLAVDRSKKILVGEPTLHRVGVYGADGHLIKKISGPPPAGDSLDPSGLWLSDRCLYVAGKANKRVDLFQVGNYSGSDCHL